MSAFGKITISFLATLSLSFSAQALKVTSSDARDSVYLEVNKTADARYEFASYDRKIGYEKLSSIVVSREEAQKHLQHAEQVFGDIKPLVMSAIGAGGVSVLVAAASKSNSLGRKAGTVGALVAGGTSIMSLAFMGGAGGAESDAKFVLHAMEAVDANQEILTIRFMDSRSVWDLNNFLLRITSY